MRKTMPEQALISIHTEHTPHPIEEEAVTKKKIFSL